MLATGNQTGYMGHIDHQVSADFVSDLAEALPVPDARIGGATGDDQLGLVRAGLFGNRRPCRAGCRLRAHRRKRR